MVAPISGPIFKLGFLETYLATCAGAVFSATISYFGAEYFIYRAANKKKKAIELAIANNIPFKGKRKFNKPNRFVVKIKRKLGIIGLSFWAPFFLSIPIGSIVVAKFYGKRKITFPLIIIGIFLNALITTSIVYTINYYA